MLRRIGFRHVLPPAQLVLYGVLCLNAYWDRPGQQPCIIIDTYGDQAVFAQEGLDLSFSHPVCHTPNAERVAISLNLPAVMLGWIIGDALLHVYTEPGRFVLTAPAVVLLWYLVGLWIDRRLGYVSLQKARFRFPRILAKVAHGFSILMVFLSAILILRALISQSHRIDPYFVASSIASWSVFLLVVTTSNLRRDGVSVNGKSPYPL
jgi:hypothetical protein